MNELQQNRYDQILRRVAGLIGTGSKVSEVLTELFPVLDVERVPGELLVLGGTRLCWGGTNATGAAGQNIRIQLFNPVDSGTLITVSSVHIGTGAAQFIRAGITNVALTTGIATQLFRDIRAGPTSRPTGEIRTQSSVAAAPATVLLRFVLNDQMVLNDENSVAVLAPGFGMEVGSNNAATEVNATFFWRERAAEQSELNF